jgi:hypothetical protein
MDQFSSADLASIQPNTHSFVVRVWLVDGAPEMGRTAWRGRITHVPSGRYQHFISLKDISAFVTPYLHQLGVKPTRLWQIRRWLRG